MAKDWTGNYNSIYKALGASSHTEEDREVNDYYATHPSAMSLLLEQEEFANVIWEPACGELHLSNVLSEAGYQVFNSDIVVRCDGITQLDFLGNYNPEDLLHTDTFDIITNPPYKYAKEFAEKGIELLKDGQKMAMFLKIQFLEGKNRKEFFLKNPPKTIYVSSSRILCAKNGKFEDYGSSAVAYAWFVWEKGFVGDPIIKWIN